MSDEGKSLSFTGPPPPGGNAGNTPKPPENAGKATPIAPPSQVPPPPAVVAPPIPTTPKANAEEKPAAVVPGKVIIRTMKDDIAASKKNPTPPIEQQPVSTSNPPSIDAIPPAKPESIVAPKEAKPDAETAMQSPEKKSHTGLIITVAILLAVMIASGGAWWFFLRAPVTDTAIVEDEVPLTAPEIIPADAALIVRYDMSEPTQKNAIQSAWAEVTGSTPTIGGLVAGNPTLILKDPQVSEFFYVLANNDTRFTLVVPITEYTTELLAQQTVVQTIESGGWYVVHPINPDAYIASFTASPLSSQGGLPPLPQSAATQWIVGPQMTSSVLASLPPALASTISTNTISAAYSGTGTQFIFTGNTTSLPALGASGNNASSLYSLIPGDAEYIWAGDNLSSAATTLTPSRFNAGILSQPANASLIQSLTGRYAYYTRTGEDGFEDIGFVIELPVELKDTLAMGDPALEGAISSLIQRVTGSATSPNIAFTDATYQESPIRFANLVDSTAALDYSIDENYIYIATSKEGMFALLDTARGRATAANQSAPWQSLIESAPATVAGENSVLTYYDNPTLNNFLPPAASNKGFPVWISVKPFGDSSQLQGIVSLGQ